MHIKGKVLDLVFTNDEHLINVHCNHDECPIDTDHYMVTLDICTIGEASQLPSCLPSTIVYNYSKADWENLTNYLLDQDFSMCYEVNDVKTIWSVIKLMVTDGMDKFVLEKQTIIISEVSRKGVNST